MFDLGLFFLIVWMLHNAAVDVSCAIKGTENPRYALKRQKALAAGRAAPKQPRYGSRDWFADLVSDGLAAQTERRRAKATKKAEAKNKQREEKPLDDLAEAVREEPRRPAPATVDTEEFPEFASSVVHDAEQPTAQADVNRGRGRTACEHCGTDVLVGHLHPRTINGQRKQVCAHCAGLIEVNARSVAPVANGQPLDKDGLYFVPSGDGRTVRSVPPPTGDRQEQVHDDPTADDWRRNGRVDLPPELRRLGKLDYFQQRARDDAAADRALYASGEPTDDRPDAQIIPFPNPKNTVKEISMATSEVNGLTTALAFAQAAADAHNSFATGGSEGYTGALAGWEVGDRCVGLAREAQEASSIAAAKWQAHKESLEEQLKVKEAYQGTPDAGNKTFLLNG